MTHHAQRGMEYHLATWRNGTDMDIRLITIVVALVMAAPVGAQVHSASGQASRPVPVAAPRAAYNLMAKSTTPFNCEAHRWPKHPHPGVKPYCDHVEAAVLQDEARRAGRPGPSDEVARLPPMGSDAARKSGVACIGGQAMRRLKNGWEQVASLSGGWLRCREQ